MEDVNQFERLALGSRHCGEEELETFISVGELSGGLDDPITVIAWFRTTASD